MSLKRHITSIVILLGVQIGVMAYALADQSVSEATVTDILFDLEMENVSYSVRSDGFLDITFGAAVTEDEYISTIKKLKAHPNITGVLAGRGKSNYCPLP